MALELVQLPNALSGLNNVYNGQESPEILGLASLSLQLPYLNYGTFYIGFDTRFKPAIVRVFFDPGDLKKNYDTLGFIQFGHITYQNIPISPKTFGMGLDYLEPHNYFYKEDMLIQHYWADIATADILSSKSANIIPPLFAYNGLLRNENFTPNDFYSYPMPNGSLTKFPIPNDDNLARCASLVGPIDFDLDTPLASDITDLIRGLSERGLTPHKKEIYSIENILQSGLLNLVVELLEITDFSTIDKIQVAGPHILIEMVDKEAEGPVFIAFFNKREMPVDNEEEVLVFAIDEDELGDLRFDMIRQSFQNIKEYAAEQGLAYADGFPSSIPLPKGSRGYSGLKPFPFIFNGDVNPELAFNYNSVLVGINGNEVTRCLGAVKWSVVREFIREDLEFGPLQIVKPELNVGPTRAYQIYLNKGWLTQSNFIRSAMNKYNDAFKTKLEEKVNPFYYDISDNIINSPTRKYNDSAQNWIGEG